MHIVCFDFIHYRNMYQASEVFILTENFGTKYVSVFKLTYRHFSLKNHSILTYSNLSQSMMIY